jgi:nudix-type nucleoside diphosphatase (YffH/AdpP family)
MARGAVIQRQRRVFDDFFKIDELLIAHERPDGTTSAAEKRLVFERGDSAAVLLFNAERKSVVLVEQFRAPALLGRRRDDPSSADGWMLETIAGVVEANETPQATAIRETFEEAGYRLRDLQLIGKFFCSPGGSSERVFLYFAEVRDRDRSGSGTGNEDIRIVLMTLDNLFDRLRRGLLDDAKLLVGAHWLHQRLRLQGSN